MMATGMPTLKSVCVHVTVTVTLAELACILHHDHDACSIALQFRGNHRQHQWCVSSSCMMHNGCSQSGNIYFTSNPSSLHWKSEL